jgi:hypothetical protein
MMQCRVVQGVELVSAAVDTRALPTRIPPTMAGTSGEAGSLIS